MCDCEKEKINVKATMRGMAVGSPALVLSRVDYKVSSIRSMAWALKVDLYMAFRVTIQGDNIKIERMR